MIKVRIDDNGTLELNRAGKLKFQEWPNTEGVYCGDWCPLFEEPIIEGTSVYMRLCHRFITCDAAEFEDLRGGVEKV